MSSMLGPPIIPILGKPGTALKDLGSPHARAPTVNPFPWGLGSSSWRTPTRFSWARQVRQEDWEDQTDQILNSLSLSLSLSLSVFSPRFSDDIPMGSAAWVLTLDNKTRKWGQPGSLLELQFVKGISISINSISTADKEQFIVTDKSHPHSKLTFVTAS